MRDEKCPISGMMLHASKALFSPGNFVFTIFVSKLEEATVCRPITCYRKIQLGGMAETQVRGTSGCKI